MKKLLFGLAMMSVCCACQEKIQYPQAAKENVIDNYFGTEVADPYRWMENDTCAEVAAWVEAENKVTQAHMSKITFRDALKDRMTELTNYEKFGTPFKRQGKYYYFKNDGLQNQSVLYVKDQLDGEARVCLDPNKLSNDGTVALTGVTFSKDGRYMAYTISRSGSDWTEIFVLDLESGKLLEDHIVWAKFTSADWCGNGFYYSAYPMPEDGKAYSNKNENHRVYYHKIGTKQTEDVVAYENPNYPLRFYSSQVDESERFLFIYESGSNLGNRLFVKDLKNPKAGFIEMAGDDTYTYNVIDVIGDDIYIHTNDNAPNYRVMKTDIRHAKVSQWKEFIAEKETPIAAVGFMAGKLMISYLQDASDHAYFYDLDGKLMHEVALPGIGSVGFSGSRNEEEIFYSFSSFTYPSSIFKYDLAKNQSELYMSPKLDFNPDEYTCEQVFFESKDGTRIPMFLTYKKGLQRDGKNPVYLYGYGGFNISLTPGFSTQRIPFLERGGIYAMVNLRGGGEYGENWHIAGTKMNKQNVFDDCIAAAEYLIAENYTCADKMSIAGGSNGGLLVGAVINQRPDLFAVALPAVGVMDMLRYQKFTIGWNWASDYGTSEDSKEMFEYLYAYSPMHNIKNDGTPYPAVFVTTADHDDRVVPAHSFKYTATLQAANTGDAPKLIRIETKAGHGSGKPLSKIIEEDADEWSFAMYHLGMKW